MSGVAEIARLYRRVLMLVGRGRVTASADGGAVQTLQVRLGADQVERGADELHDMLPSLQQYGHASRPLAGADAVAIFVGGDRDNGVVVATGDQRYRLHLAPGEVAIHDDLGHRVHLTRTGLVIDGAGQNITIQNAPQVVVTGGDVIADGISLKAHTHSDPQGGSTGVSQ